jgi:hypothetical protein
MLLALSAAIKAEFQYLRSAEILHFKGRLLLLESMRKVKNLAEIQSTQMHFRHFLFFGAKALRTVTFLKFTSDDVNVYKATVDFASNIHITHAVTGVTLLYTSCH